MPDDCILKVSNPVDCDALQAHTQELQQGMASLVAASVHSEHLIQLFKHTLQAARVGTISCTVL